MDAGSIAAAILTALVGAGAGGGITGYWLKRKEQDNKHENEVMPVVLARLTSVEVHGEECTKQRFADQKQYAEDRAAAEKRYTDERLADQKRHADERAADLTRYAEAHAAQCLMVGQLQESVRAMKESKPVGQRLEELEKYIHKGVHDINDQLQPAVIHTRILEAMEKKLDAMAKATDENRAAIAAIQHVTPDGTLVGSTEAK